MGCCATLLSWLAIARRGAEPAGGAARRVSDCLSPSLSSRSSRSRIAIADAKCVLRTCYLSYYGRISLPIMSEILEVVFYEKDLFCLDQRVDELFLSDTRFQEDGVLKVCALKCNLYFGPVIGCKSVCCCVCSCVHNN